ncbi:trehalase-like isoform X2 [Dysidea avara]|uniref:trehalase-like isoform X2 n=1 Tax=Dysidea avara TaxID=196820 RepID=UPI0033314FB0
MPLKFDPSTVLDNFSRLPTPPTDEQLRQFVAGNFNSTPDLVNWQPPDWVERPAFVDSIRDEQLRQWALNLTAIWPKLGRQLSPDVHANPQRHSLLPVPNPFIVAGGRFSEFYYWDSYWIVRGLLLCEMYDTARGMIENMATLIDQYGLVPNGGRVYYSRRSQPPLLTQMVAAYYNATENDTFVKEILPLLEKEYHFWQYSRFVVLEPSDLPVNYYATDTNLPRPESYQEDYNTSRAISNETARSELFTNLASAAESGWDFSSRWLDTEGPMADQLASIRTTSVVPVELNAILCQNEATLAWFNNITGNYTGAYYYNEARQEREEIFDEMFWNETTGTWRDIDITTGQHLDGFYLSSVAPLVWGCGPSNTSRQLSTLRYLKDAGFLDYPGGIPTSTVDSGQQWDFPNAWPPLQWMFIYGLSQGSHESLKMAAKEAAQKWVNANWIGWKVNNTMYEKYDCEVPGAPGRGGEYIVQSGFGWTNGVILDLLSLYGSSLTAPPLNLTTTPVPTTAGNHDNDSNSAAWVAPIAILIPLMLLSVVCVIWGRWVYKRGKKRYWQRVQNEHLMAYGATEDSGGVGQGRSYSIGDEDEDSKSVSKENSLVRHDETDSSTNNGTSTISAMTVTTVLQLEDSGILSNGTCTDNNSDSNKAETPQEEANGNIITTDGDEQSSQPKEETLSLTKEADSPQTHEPSPEKILVTDV